MKKIRVVVIEPNQNPCIKLIDNTLESFQNIVGGYIENVGVNNNYVMIVNEEGLIYNLPFNKKVGFHDLYGNIVVAKYDLDGEFVSMDEKVAQTVVELFKENNVDVNKLSDI